jgi:hypothetical protein
VPRRKPQEQARKGYAAWALNRAKKNVNTSVALEAKGGRKVRVCAPRPSQQENMCTKHVLLHACNICTAASFRLAALS